MKNRSLTEGPILSSITYFTLPFLFSNLLQILYGTVDTLVIGNFGETSGVSAVACGAQLLSLFTFLAMGLSSGGTVLVGQSIGAKNYNRAVKVVGNLIIDFSIIAIILTAIASIFSSTFLGFLNVPKEAMAEAIIYMKICSYGIPLIIGYNIVCALLRAMGDSKTPLIFVGIACVINIALDLILTGYFKMGVMGVAIATITAQGFSFLFSLIYVMKKGLVFKFSFKDIKFELETTLDIFKIGLPIGVQSILINLSFMFITAIINELGLTSSAAMGIGDKIINFAFMPQSAFMNSGAVIVAQNYGAGKMDRAKKSIIYSTIICVLVEIVFLLVCWIFPNFFPSIFSDDEEVIMLAGEYMKAYSVDGLLTAITFNMAALLNGCGKTAFNMLQNLISTFLGRIPATYLLSRIPNASLFIIGCAAPLSTILSVVMLFLYIKLGKWSKEA